MRLGSEALYACPGEDDWHRRHVMALEAERACWDMGQDLRATWAPRLEAAFASLMKIVAKQAIAARAVAPPPLQVGAPGVADAARVVAPPIGRTQGSRFNVKTQILE